MALLPRHPATSQLKLIHDIAVSSISPQHFLRSICPLVKQRKLPFPNSTPISFSIFEFVHIDLWGPCSVMAYDGSKYFLTIVEDLSQCTWTYMLKRKSDA